MLLWLLTTGLSTGLAELLLDLGLCSRMAVLHCDRGHLLAVLLLNRHLPSLLAVLHWCKVSYITRALSRLLTRRYDWTWGWG